MEINGVLKSILDSIKSIPVEFGIREYDDEIMYGEDLADQIYAAVPSADIYNGCSKCAIVDKACDYVVKIPFNGMWFESYNDECSDDDYFEEFHYANDIEDNYEARDWDYCENELIKYEKAVDAGFGEFFAETVYYGKIDNTPIYIQEKAMSYSKRLSEGDMPNSSKEAQKVYKENKDKLCCYINTDWVILAIAWYGLARVLAFLKYIDEENLDTDLHAGNIGFTESGRPVLIDWAGWRD